MDKRSIFKFDRSGVSPGSGALQPNLEPEELFATCCQLLRRGDVDANRYLAELERFPEYARGWTTLGATLLELNKPPAASVAFDYALRIKHPPIEAILGKAECLLKTNAPEQARHLIEARVPEWKAQAGPAKVLGRACYAAGALPAAAAAFKHAAEQDSADAETWFRLGLAEQDQSHWQAAVAAYRKAVIKQPRMAEAALNLGICLQEIRNMDASMRAYAAAWHARPSCFNRIAQALTSASTGRLWLSAEELKQTLRRIGADRF